MNTFRNRLAHRIANFALRRIATDDYAHMLDGVIRVGMKTLDPDQLITSGFVKRDGKSSDWPPRY